MIYWTHFRPCWAGLLAIFLWIAVLAPAHADNTDSKSTTPVTTEEQPEE